MSQTLVWLLRFASRTTSFFDGVDDRGEVVISQNNVGSVFGDIRASLTHGNTDISALEGWRIVDTVTGLQRPNQSSYILQRLMRSLPWQRTSSSDVEPRSFGPWCLAHNEPRPKAESVGGRFHHLTTCQTRKPSSPKHRRHLLASCYN